MMVAGATLKALARGLRVGVHRGAVTEPEGTEGEARLEACAVLVFSASARAGAGRAR